MGFQGKTAQNPASSKIDLAAEDRSPHENRPG
jgi:hypothetical protein